MKNKFTVFFYLLFNLLMNETCAADASTLVLNEPAEEQRSIRLINAQDLQTLMRFCIDHAKFHQDPKERDFSALTFAKVSKSLKLANELKGLRYLDDVFGIYVCYVTKSNGSGLLAGIIKMLGDSSKHNGVEGYAECEMTMHPSYRGRGVGPHFRMQFHDQVIIPILGTTRIFVDSPAVFQGTIGYIHANNIASRRMVTKLGFAPVRFSPKPYFGGNEAIQLMYVYPPLSESYELPAPLPQTVVNIILENNLERNSDILIKYLDQKPKILECFEASRSHCIAAIQKENVEIPTDIPLEVFFAKIGFPEEMIFVNMIKSFIPSFLETHAKGQLLKPAQEIALLEQIKEFGEENPSIFSRDGDLARFIQEQDIQGKRLLFKNLMLAS